MSAQRITKRLDLTSLDKGERHRLRSIVLACLLGALMAFLVFSARADETPQIPLHVVEQDGMKLRLLATPCTDPTSALIGVQIVPPKFHERWKASKSDWRMKDGSWRKFDGCWLTLTAQEAQAPEDVFFFTFSDGQYGAVLKSEVMKPVGAGA